MKKHIPVHFIALGLFQICFVLIAYMLIKWDEIYHVKFSGVGVRLANFRHGKRFSKNNTSKRRVESALKINQTFNEKSFRDKHILVCHGPTGRLGNAMFDFAVSRGIAHTLDYRYVMRPNHSLLKHFEMNQTLTEDVENVMKIPLSKWRNATWRDSKIYLSYNITLSGYWRVWSYFKDVSDEVRRSFTIKSEFLNQAKVFLRNNTPEVKTLVGVHVRRGDFLTNGSVEFGRVVASKEYIKTAMNIFRRQYSDTIFVVASNDQVWCKENLTGKDVLFSSFKSAILDMALLSLCDHAVLTTGTFGWWGGFLAGGQVIYCKDFPKPDSQLEKKILFRGEVYRPEWIGLRNCSIYT